MELDGYNEELALAFEYQGIQHYEYNTHFHKNFEDFEQRVKDDLLKRELCKIKGVTLIEIPYTIDYDKMIDYIICQCEGKYIRVPKKINQIDLKEIINKAYKNQSVIEKNTNSQSQIDDFITN
jgi:hypothetical protein